MTARERLLRIKTMEKAQQNKDYAKQIGIEHSNPVIKNNHLTTEKAK